MVTVLWRVRIGWAQLSLSHRYQTRWSELVPEVRLRLRKASPQGWPGESSTQKHGSASLTVRLWNGHFASQSRCTSDPVVECHQSCAEEFGQCHVARVVDSQMAPHLPRPRRQQLVRPQLDIQVEQVSVSLCGLVGGYESGELVAADDAGRFEWKQTGSGKVGSAENACHPLAVGTGVQQ